MSIGWPQVMSGPILGTPPVGVGLVTTKPQRSIDHLMTGWHGDDRSDLSQCATELLQRHDPLDDGPRTRLGRIVTAACARCCRVTPASGVPVAPVSG